MVPALFWFSFSVTVYAYFGYAGFLWILNRLRPEPVAPGQFEPSVSIIIAARNEEQSLPGKLENLYALQYPEDRLQIVIVSDGSTDDTNKILFAHKTFVTPVLIGSGSGKAYALNEGVKHATGDVLVFFDSRQTVAPQSIKNLLRSFADPTIGAVSGELILQSMNGTEGSDGLGIYWKLEKFVRRMESATGSVVGVTGAIYAIRRDLYTPMPPGTILDDVFIPMNVVLKGKRVIFDPSAVAKDRIFSERGKEFSRKVRTLTGNYQLLRFAPWLLTPRNPLLFRFICHKLLRLVVPLLLFAMLITSAFAQGSLYREVFWAQISMYALAILGWILPVTKKSRLVSIPNTFLILNIAAVLAFCNFVVGRQRVWVK